MRFFFIGILVLLQPASGGAGDLVDAARAQIGRTVIYDGSYQALAYPGGDVPLERGVCSDVVIRALRDCCDMDLQQLVHEDMQAHFSEYPQTWGLTTTDKNIDHRRVPNLYTYFQRKGYAVPVSEDLEDYRPGDLVTCIVPPNLPHIMIVSDTKNSRGIPLVIHNIGLGAVEEDRLFAFRLTGHFRIENGGQGAGGPVSRNAASRSCLRFD